MTRHKDQKRLVRERMKKTGESYTAARAVIVARKQRDATPQKAVYAAPRDQWAKLAGQRDEVMKQRTGRTWADWVRLLDKADAHKMSHTQIACLVRSEHDVSSWWAQTVAVGYERIRGMRGVGQRHDGDHAASKSKTFKVDLSTLYQMFADARRRKAWLPDGVRRVRTATRDKSIRFDWNDDTRVHAYFLPKGPHKSTVAIEHAKLPDTAGIERAKAFWDERLKVLAQILN